MPASSGRPGPGEITMPAGRDRRDVVDGDGVVAHDLEVGPDLAHLLDEIPGERVVVVDDEDGPHERGRYRVRPGTSTAGALASCANGEPTTKTRKSMRAGASDGRYIHPERSGKSPGRSGATSTRARGGTDRDRRDLRPRPADIILNYLGVLPDAVSQWYLLAGIVVIFVGFAAMMKLR